MARVRQTARKRAVGAGKSRAKAAAVNAWAEAESETESTVGGDTEQILRWLRALPDGVIEQSYWRAVDAEGRPYAALEFRLYKVWFSSVQFIRSAHASWCV